MKQNAMNDPVLIDRVLCLRRVGGFSEREIAKRVGMSRSWVWEVLRRAKGSRAYL